ncbi:MAG: hypothetical protein Q8868_01635 [Bacteroidota bacterium]|nr:hypothetical protein [Bacteroidota bacterium]
MSTSSTIIGLALLFLFILPVVVMARSGKAKKKRMLNDLMSEALKNSASITESDSWDDSALGLDTQNKKIVYIIEKGSDKKASIFSLSELKSFRTTPDMKNNNGQKPNLENANNMSLIFSFKDPAKSEINISFYIAGFGRMTKTEKDLFEKWSGLILKFHEP